MSATVECFGVSRTVSVALMSEPIAVGDYVLVRSGRYVVERLEKQSALQSLALMEELALDSETPRRADQQRLGLVPVEP